MNTISASTECWGGCAIVSFPSRGLRRHQQQDLAAVLLQLVAGDRSHPRVLQRAKRNRHRGDVVAHGAAWVSGDLAVRQVDAERLAGLVADLEKHVLAG